MRQRHQTVNLSDFQAGVSEKSKTREAEQALHKARTQDAAGETEETECPVQDGVECHERREEERHRILSGGVETGAAWVSVWLEAEREQEPARHRPLMHRRGHGRGSVAARGTGAGVGARELLSRQMGTRPAREAVYRDAKPASACFERIGVGMGSARAWAAQCARGRRCCERFGWIQGQRQHALKEIVEFIELLPGQVIGALSGGRHGHPSASR